MSEYNFKECYDPLNLRLLTPIIGISKISPPFQKILDTIILNDDIYKNDDIYNKEYIKYYDIPSLKIICINKKIKYKFLKTYLKYEPEIFYNYKYSKQILTLLQLQKKNIDNPYNFHYYIHAIIAELNFKLGSYDKAIEHFHKSYNYIKDYENNITMSKFEENYDLSKFKNKHLICFNSKYVMDIVYNMGVITLIQNKFNDAVKYFAEQVGFHKKTKQILIILLLKYNKKFYFHNLLTISHNINSHFNHIIYENFQECSLFEDHYILGFMYYILDVVPYKFLTIKHLETSAKYYLDANYLLGNIYMHSDYYYNIFKSLTYYNNIKKLNKKKSNKYSTTICKYILKENIKNIHNFDQLYFIYKKYYFKYIVTLWKNNINGLNLLYYKINTLSNSIHKYKLINTIFLWKNNIKIQSIYNYMSSIYITKIQIHKLFMNTIIHWKLNIYISNLYKLYKIYYNYWFSKIIYNWRTKWLFS